MTIQTSLDWEEYRRGLVKNLHDLPYNHDLLQMLRNLDGMVTRLAQAEVEARRTRRDSTKTPEYQQLIAAIQTFEQFQMLAVLYR